jgi:hypothetical protein
LDSAGSRVDANRVDGTVIADDADFVHGAVALLDGLAAHDAAGMAPLRDHDRFCERQTALIRELRDDCGRRGYVWSERGPVGDWAGRRGRGEGEDDRNREDAVHAGRSVGLSSHGGQLGL